MAAAARSFNALTRAETFAAADAADLTARLFAALACLAAFAREAASFLRAASTAFFSAPRDFCSLARTSLALATAGLTAAFFGAVFLAGALEGDFLAADFFAAFLGFAVAFFLAVAITPFSTVVIKVLHDKSNNYSATAQYTEPRKLFTAIQHMLWASEQIWKTRNLHRKYKCDKMPCFIG